ncbi:hypothetical protein M0805_001192 [Coniferiporia weirii]|nr:hypothetical protein M0805_001192 [Coniferiporia weirii]
MSTSTKPLVAVTAALGAQGASVVNYLLNDGFFRVRAITRNVASDKARALVARGAEVVSADYNDHESIYRAFEGAYGIFGNTTYWEAMDAGKETEHGIMPVDAAKKAGVKHFVWSTLEHSEVPHGESKARVDDYLKASGLPGTSLITAFYYENFYIFPDMAVKKDEMGKLVAHWPLMWTDGPLGAFSVAETGAYVLAALKDPEQWIGNDIRLLSEIITPRQYVETLRKVSGAEINLVETSKEDFFGLRETAMGIVEMRELWIKCVHFCLLLSKIQLTGSPPGLTFILPCNSMKWKYDNNGNASGDPELTKRLNPTRITFEEFITANIDKLVPK